MVKKKGQTKIDVDPARRSERRGATKVSGYYRSTTKKVKQKTYRRFPRSTKKQMGARKKRTVMELKRMKNEIGLSIESKRIIELGINKVKNSKGTREEIRKIKNQTRAQKLITEQKKKKGKP